MKFDKITIQPLYPTGNFLNIRIGIDMSLEGLDDPKVAMKAALELANEFHKENFPKLYNKEGQPLFNNYTGEEAEIQEKKETKLTGFAHWENEINKCTTIEKPDGIESFRSIADMNPKLKEVFNNKLNELKNGAN